jgi:7-cyano-7-deazaguanine synthase in queuosine biosynthesis
VAETILTKPDGWRVALKDDVLSVTAPAADAAGFEAEGTVAVIYFDGVQGDGCGACPACELRRRGLDRYLADKSGIRARLYEKSGLGEKSGS